MPTKEVTEEIGIICGNGKLPLILSEELIRQGKEPNLILLKDFATPVLEKFNYQYSGVASVGKIFAFFRENNVKKICLAGGFSRPSFTSIIPDLTGAKLLSRLISLKKAGDNSILLTVLNFIEENGFQIISAQDIAPTLLASSGANGKRQPTQRQMEDILYGYEVANKIGELDIGQAVIVQNGEILGVEGKEGTANLIKRCANLQYGGKGAILVKACKPNQDKRIDLPSIGEETIENLSKLGFAGIALSAGQSLIVNEEDTLHLADKEKLFIYGV